MLVLLPPREGLAAGTPAAVPDHVRRGHLLRQSYIYDLRWRFRWRFQPRSCRTAAADGGALRCEPDRLAFTRRPDVRSRMGVAPVVARRLNQVACNDLDGYPACGGRDGNRDVGFAADALHSYFGAVDRNIVLGLWSSRFINESEHSFGRPQSSLGLVRRGAPGCGADRCQGHVRRNLFSAIMSSTTLDNPDVSRLNASGESEDIAGCRFPMPI